MPITTRCTPGRSTIRAAFWDLVWDFCGVIGDKGERALVDGDKMPGARFFPDARLNFAENLLRTSGRRRRDRLPRRGQGRAPPVAGTSCTRWSRACSRRCARSASKPGDRVAAMLPNMPEAIAGMLAAASLGAVWSSCSPDFGERGRARPLRPDRAEAVHRLRRLLVRRQARSTSPTRSQAIAAEPADASRRSSSSPISATADAVAAGHAARGDARRLRSAPFAPKPVDLRAAALRPSALHPLLVGHDRRAEMHRALGRRHAAAASQGAPAALRHRGRRPRLLFHHLRLDDVELAGLGPRLRRDAAALRRLAVPSRRQRAVRLRRRPRR